MNEELLPIVDSKGNVVGDAPRSVCHNGESMLLHPVVHLHVFNSKGELFLQHRPRWKHIQPNRWDTAVGGHVDFGERIETALHREVSEEIGLECFEPHFLMKYEHQSEMERELVYVFYTITDTQPRPSDELDGGRFFTLSELSERMGHDFFTPNFESEWSKVSKLLNSEIIPNNTI